MNIAIFNTETNEVLALDRHNFAFTCKCSDFYSFPHVLAAEEWIANFEPEIDGPWKTELVVIAIEPDLNAMLYYIEQIALEIGRHDADITHMGETNLYYGIEEESGYRIITLQHNDAAMPLLQQYVENNYPGSHCQHEYDCCGRTYESKGHIIYSDHDVAIVRVGWHINI
jgi:hypothetical protein